MKKPLILLAILLGLYVYSPYHAVREYCNAINSGDAEALAGMVDYEEMRKSMKAQMMEKAAKGAPMQAAKMKLMEPMLDKMLEGMISEKGIGKLLAMSKTMNGNKEQTVTSRSWVGANEMAVKMADDKSTLKFRFTTSGWKLSAAELDMSKAAPQPLALNPIAPAPPVRPVAGPVATKPIAPAKPAMKPVAVRPLPAPKLAASPKAK